MYCYITSLSIKPIRIIPSFGFIVSLLGFIGGIQLLSLGVIGEYVGKMYLITLWSKNGYIHFFNNKKMYISVFPIFYPQSPTAL